MGPVKSNQNTTTGLPRRALKINEAAQVLGVKAITVRRLIQRGLLHPCRVLRHPLIPIEQIEALLSNQ